MQVLDGHHAVQARAHAIQQIRTHIVAAGLRPGDPLPSYRELAERLKVSLMTVKRAMEDLIREGVLVSVDRKGAFVARQIAATRRELRTIGLLFGASRPGLVETPYRREFLYGFLRQADIIKADVQFFSFWSRRGAVAPKEVARLCDGVIVLGALRASVLGEFVKEHIPMVVADFLSERLALHHVVCDNAVLVRSAVARLQALQHRDLLYLGHMDQVSGNPWFAPDSDHRERREAFQEIARRQRASWRVCLSPPNTAGGLQSVPLIEFLVSRRPPTAVVVDNVGMACTVVREIESQTRLRVPRDVSVVAVAGTLGENVMPSHVVAQNAVRFREMGSRAVECLEQRCNSLRPTRRTVERIGADFAAGDTLGPPRAS